MINEERMSVYVRLGIRLLYKGLKSRRMEKDKSKSCQSANSSQLLEMPASHGQYYQRRTDY
jgi:phosphatidylserine decarboxylase